MLNPVPKYFFSSPWESGSIYVIVDEQIHIDTLDSGDRQTRRKLEDVGKKLEILYDKLREQSLPVATTNGLHDIVHTLYSYDYQSCLVKVNQLVSTGSFTVLSEFVPGLTPNTLERLHQLIGYLKASDFPNAMAHYTGIVSGPSFAEIAGFMPSVKVLLQLSQQHQVAY
eukprot:maker-scaffold201_size263271-snap-gene-1.31 protein:Tk08052 transcript:maker-scaffold201_size263271-snap-gene-1.31-mRNA-1 annotation:"hypothetical protein LOTGIDRAFT_106381"